MIKFNRSLGDSIKISKPALLFVSGRHKDNQGRWHEFDEHRIQNIAANTNKWFEQGGRIPFQRDHAKTQDCNLGDLEGKVYVERLTSDNLPDPKHRNLIGRLGIFTQDLVAKGTDNVKAVVSKTIKTLSPGIDPVTETIMEISATPFPAIIGPALFSQEGVNSDNDNFLLFGAVEDSAPVELPSPSKIKKVFSMQEALGREEDNSRLEEEYLELAKALYATLISYHNATEEELLGRDPIENSYQAIDYFVTELESLFELIQEEPSEEETQDPAGEAPINQESSEGIISGRPSKYSSSKNISTFSQKTKFIGFARANIK